jgi:hypothetical protein
MGDFWRSHDGLIGEFARRLRVVVAPPIPSMARNSVEIPPSSPWFASAPVSPNKRSLRIGSRPFHPARARHSRCSRPARPHPTDTPATGRDHAAGSSTPHCRRCNPRGPFPTAASRPAARLPGQRRPGVPARNLDSPDARSFGHPRSAVECRSQCLRKSAVPSRSLKSVVRTPSLVPGYMAARSVLVAVAWQPSALACLCERQPAADPRRNYGVFPTSR